MIIVDELIGFITANRRREQVIQALSSGPASREHVAKVSRIPSRILGGLLEELAGRGLVVESEGEWALTELGREVEARRKALS